MSKNFQKNIEDFECGKCGAHVTGDGFTNHCPKCLWAKHVDIHPGDRAEKCQGLMEPVAIISERVGESILHRCTVCKVERKNKLAQNDDYDQVLEIAKKRAEKFSGSLS